MKSNRRRGTGLHLYNPFLYIEWQDSLNSFVHKEIVKDEKEIWKQTLRISFELKRKAGTIYKNTKLIEF